MILIENYALGDEEKVPPAVFRAERARAFDPASPTGHTGLSLARDHAGAARALYGGARREHFTHNLQSSNVYYAIRGGDTAACASEQFDWKQGDNFCLPGNNDIKLVSEDSAIRRRPHNHSSAALTLSIEGVYTMVDGAEMAWESDTLRFTWTDV